MFLRSPYNYDRAAVSRQTGLKCEDPTRAQQSGKEEADINTIVKRFGVTGMLPQRAGVPIQDIDFGEVFDFQSAMNVVVQAERAFMDIPADIRLRFGNDPGEFVKFAADPDNFDEMVKLGLANPPPKPDPTPANPALPDTPKG